MAGDWIKMRVDLCDDPAVVLIASRLDIAEDEVVGKLHRLWCWADKHTTDGTAPAITARWVDRYVNRSGFADAMTEAGWIEFDEHGVTFPSFDRHNGESAKRRVEATLRQRLSRENRDKGVTGDARTPIPKPFMRFVFQRDGFQCVFCGTRSDEKTESSRKARLSVDHLKPVSRGGLTTVENLACACRQCNNEKNDRTPEEWGLIPTFLQDGVIYNDSVLVTSTSQKKCDTSVTREEKRREESKTIGSKTGVGEPEASREIEKARPSDLSAAMRRNSIEAQPGDPRIVAAAEAGISVETIEAACAEAKASDPVGRIKPGFVIAIAERWTREAATPRARGSPQRSYHDERADVIAQLTGRKAAHQPSDAGVIDVNDAIPRLGS